MAVSRRRAGQVIDEYERALTGTVRERGGEPLSAATVRLYAGRVRQFLSWLTTDPVAGDPLRDPVARDRAVGAHLAWLAGEQGRAAATVRAHATAIAHFYRHLGLGSPDVRAGGGGPVGTVRPVASAEVQRRFLQVAGRIGSLRDRALCLTLYWTGVTAGELTGLDVPDVQPAGRGAGIDVRTAGGRAVRRVPLDRRARPVLRELCEQRRRESGAAAAVFVNRYGERLSVRTVDAVVAGLGRRAGLDPTPTPRMLRLGYGARLLQEGVDVLRVAELMGYRSLDSLRALL